MTFNELRTEVMDRLNLSSTDASTRIGRAINRKYRLVTSSIGMQLSRRTTISKVVTVSGSSVTFTNTEKVIEVSNRNVSPYKTLTELTLEELREQQPYTDSDSPTQYAIKSHAADSVTIELNRIPETAYTLTADVHQAVADLSGTNEPAFPESFHDILIEGVMSDELRKMEKPQLAQIAQNEYQRILSDLRMWIAKSNYFDVFQAKRAPTSTGTATGGGSGGSGSSALSLAELMIRISLRA